MVLRRMEVGREVELATERSFGEHGYKGRMAGIGYMITTWIEVGSWTEIP